MCLIAASCEASSAFYHFYLIVDLIGGIETGTNLDFKAMFSES